MCEIELQEVVVVALRDNYKCPRPRPPHPPCQQGRGLQTLQTIQTPPPHPRLITDIADYQMEN